MALISDAQKNKDGINVLNQIGNFITFTNSLTGIVNTFGDLKITYPDPEDIAEINTKLNQALTLITTLRNLIIAKIG